MVTIHWGDWQFRARFGNILESKNDVLKLDWATRTPAEMQLLDDHCATMWTVLNDLNATLPKVGEDLPHVEPQGDAVSPDPNRLM